MKKLFLSLLLVLLFPLTAYAELRVDITRGVVEPMPIAITTFYSTAPQHSDFATQIPQVISANLESSGLFKPVNPRAFVQNVASLHVDGPRFGEWRAINTQAMVSGAVTSTADGRTRVEFRLWDVFGEKQLIGTAFMTTPQNWRRIAHIISDEIYKRLTGEDGYFDTRIVYVAESGPTTKRIKRLAIMDQDGQNHKYLTDGRNLVLTPRFSPSRQQITYMSYGRGGPRVYLYDINSGRHEVLGNFPNMTFAPRFSPDGSKVIMSMASRGNTDIYEMSLRTRQPRRITTHSSIDTAPSYSPDGRYQWRNGS